MTHSDSSLPSASPETANKATVLKLKARIRELEAILLCKECGHLRNEHMDNDSPCYGGRTPEMPSTEGDYCDCDGFASEESR